MAAGQFELLKMHYDPDSDVLYCSLGDPRDAVGEESQEEGVIRRYDPNTHELVGFTVVNFKRRFVEHPGSTISVAASARA